MQYLFSTQPNNLLATSQPYRRTTSSNVLATS